MITVPFTEELVLFSRSGYNRAGAERVMRFCCDDEYEDFMHAVSKFEKVLIDFGISLLKYYLDISKDEQKQRLADRRSESHTQWTSSLIDAVAIAHWKAYFRSCGAMLLRTHTLIAPWIIVRADDKHLAHMNLMPSILSSFAYEGKKALFSSASAIAYEFTPERIGSDRLAP